MRAISDYKNCDVVLVDDDNNNDIFDQDSNKKFE